MYSKAFEAALVARLDALGRFMRTAVADARVSHGAVTLTCTC